MLSFMTPRFRSHILSNSSNFFKLQASSFSTSSSLFSNVALIKQLRLTLPGVSMKLARKALIENDNDLEKSIQWLEKEMLAHGIRLATNRKASGMNRLNQGWIGIARNESGGCIVEVNTETDFVARTPLVSSFVQSVAHQTLATALPLPQQFQDYPSSLLHQQFTDALHKLMSQVGEQLHLVRASTIFTPSIGMYLHPRDPLRQVGRIGALVAFTSPLPLHVADQVAKLIVGFQPTSMTTLKALPYHLTPPSEAEGSSSHLTLVEEILKQHQTDILSYRRFEVGEPLPSSHAHTESSSTDDATPIAQMTV